MVDWTLVKSLRDLPNATGRKLWLTKVDDLTDLSPLFDRSDLEGLRIVMCDSFRSLDGIGRWPSLTTLDVSHCPELESLAPLADLPALRRLQLFGNKKLTSLSGVRALREPVQLSVPFCAGLTDVSDLASLTTLRELSLEGCLALDDVAPLAALPQLVSLSLKGCRSLASLQGFGDHPALETLSLEGCMSLRDLRGLGSVPSLRRLDLGTAIQLRSLDGLQGAPRLERLHATACSTLHDVSALAATPTLRELSLGECPALEDVDVLGALAQLEALELWGTRIARLPVLAKSLRRISVNNTPLRSIAGVLECTALDDLQFRDTDVRDRAEIARAVALPKLTKIALPRDSLPSPSARVQSGDIVGWQGIPALRQMFAANLDDRARRWAGLSGAPRELELFRRVIENPRSIDARREYAAELLRTREPRGEFIVLDEPRMNDPHAHRSPRNIELLDAHSVEWFHEVRRRVESGSIGGGFIQEIWLSVARAARHGAEIAAMTPLRAVHFDGIREVDDRRDLFATAWMSNLEAIHWQYAQPDDLLALCSSPHMQHVQTLDLADVALPVPVARAIASGAFPALRELRLVKARPMPGAFEPIASIPLTTLDLSYAYGADDAVRTIAASPAMASLRVLRLGGCFLLPESFERLAASPHLGALEEIDLRGNGTEDALREPPAFIQSPNLRSLRLVLTNAFWSREPSGETTIATAHGPVTYRVSPGSNYD